MSCIASFAFNPFQENTYIIHDETNECIIIDPGCYTDDERRQITSYIEDQKLKPVLLVNTHCHVDHILGNKFIFETYGLKPIMHQTEVEVLKSAGQYSTLFGITVEQSPLPEKFLDEGDVVEFGNTKLQVIFTPGHSPGEICLYNEGEAYLIAGDVLFLQSIGRTDLPGGDYDTLMTSIKEKLMVLKDDVKVYPGHGPETTIGFERQNNSFITSY